MTDDWFSYFFPNEKGRRCSLHVDSWCRCWIQWIPRSISGSPQVSVSSLRLIKNISWLAADITIQISRVHFNMHFLNKLKSIHIHFFILLWIYCIYIYNVFVLISDVQQTYLIPLTSRLPHFHVINISVIKKYSTTSVFHNNHCWAQFSLIACCRSWYLLFICDLFLSGSEAVPHTEIIFSVNSFTTAEKTWKCQEWECNSRRNAHFLLLCLFCRRRQRSWNVLLKNKQKYETFTVAWTWEKQNYTPVVQGDIDLWSKDSSRSSLEIYVINVKER